MARFRDMREFIEGLENVGELITVDAEVDPLNFELSSLIRHSEDGPNRAVLFKRVKGYEMPVVTNLFGSVRRCAIGCGVQPTPEEVERCSKDPHGSAGGIGGLSVNAFTMDLEERAMACLLREKMIEADRLAALGKNPARIVDTGPCKEVIIKEGIDLPAMFPVPWHCEGDVGPFINPGALVQRDPDTGVLNIGIRRHQIGYELYGKKRMGALIVEPTDGWRIMKKYQEREQPCEVALCIGVDPVTEIVGNYCSPHLTYSPPFSEFDLYGAVVGEPLELVRCETVDLEVPATAEIVIEGFIPPKERIYEGPMAEFTDMYAEQGPREFIEVTAITHRKNPIFYTLMSGRSEEHRVLGIFSAFGREQNVLARVRQLFPTVKDVALFGGSHGFHLVAALRQRYPGEDKMLLHYLIAATLYKYITIVDDDIEPHNSEEVEWARAMRAGADPDDFQVFPRTHTRQLDPERDENYRTTRLGVLATLPYGQPYKRTGPPLEMLEKTRSLFEQSSRTGIH
ncbi:MAG: UbiD family decarboxylase [Chloroflexi bacterium]|nr:UbiD family decarboxylase [Chloroflexota bacterium]